MEACPAAAFEIRTQIVKFFAAKPDADPILNAIAERAAAMLHPVKNLLKNSMFVQRNFRRYVQPHLPSYEPETYLLRGMKFDRSVDIGANNGTYSILLSQNSDYVDAFEPVQHSFDILRNLGLGNVSLHQIALGSEAGETEIALPIVDGEVDYCAPTLRSVATGEHQAIARQKVTVARFDDFAQQIDFARVDFVKMDVEGFELHVLHGMTRLLDQRKAAFMIEVEQRHNPNYRDVFAYLATWQYQPYFTVDGARLQPLDIAELPNLQSAERQAQDAGRTFRFGERKNYINNIFFLQAAHKAKFHAA